MYLLVRGRGVLLQVPDNLLGRHPLCDFSLVGVRTKICGVAFPVDVGAFSCGSRPTAGATQYKDHASDGVAGPKNGFVSHFPISQLVNVHSANDKRHQLIK
jgi:hypothetical protein